MPRKDVFDSGRFMFGSLIIGLLLFSTVTILSANAAGASSQNCTSNLIGKKILDAGSKVSEQAARTFAESSSQYQLSTAGFASTFSGIANDWEIDSRNCVVSWHDVSVNYLLSGKDSTTVLTIDENPTLGVIYNVSVRPEIYPQISTQSSETYSGYGIAANSDHSTEVNYSTAYWYVPTVSTTSSPGCGSTPPSSCEFVAWVGLQNSTYDGPDHTVSKGEVIQTGTQGQVGCNPSCTSAYWGWSDYLSANSNGIKYNNYSYCASSFIPQPGDEMTGQVGSQEIINGTSGNTYYTILTDWNVGYSCERAYTFSNHHGTYGKEYFADFFAERPQCGSTCYFALPQFSNFEFFDVGMVNEATGAYTYYNFGYGFGSYMFNSQTQDTTTKPMIENSGGSTYGYFYEDWNSSAGT